MIFVGIIFILFGSEYGIKRYMDKRKGPDKLICKDKIRIRTFRNKAAAFGKFEKHPMFITILSVLLILVLSLYFILTFGVRENTLQKLGLSILLGGAYSNAYDRLHRKYVVDYFSFQTKSKLVNAIVFNLADFFIVIGAFLLVISSK